MPEFPYDTGRYRDLMVADSRMQILLHSLPVRSTSMTDSTDCPRCFRDVRRECVCADWCGDDDCAAEWPDDCLLRDCRFTEAGTCEVHGETCPDCPCGTPLHWEPR